MQINQQALTALRRRSAGKIILSLISGLVFDVFYAYILLTLPSNIKTFAQMFIYLFPLAIFFILDTVISTYVFISGHFRLRTANRAHLLVAAVNGKAGAGPREISSTLRMSPRKLKRQLRFLINEGAIDNAYWNKKTGGFTSVPVIPAFYNAQKCEKVAKKGRCLYVIGSFLAEVAFVCFYFVFVLGYSLSILGLVFYAIVFIAGSWMLIAGKGKLKATKNARFDALCLVGDPSRSPATIAEKQKISEKKASDRLHKAIQKGYFNTIRRMPNASSAPVQSC